MSRISVVSQFMNNLTEVHMKVVYHILTYLKNNSRKGTLFQKNTKKGTLKIFKNKLGWLHN